MGRMSLDELLEKYTEQFGDVLDKRKSSNERESGVIPEEPIEDVIKQVSKRFDFKEKSKDPAKNIPNRKFIPFYSHYADVFSDLEKNLNLFQDGKSPEEESIGVLSRLKDVNVTKFYPSEEIQMVVKSNSKAALYKNMAKDWFYFVTKIIGTIDPYKLVTVQKRKHTNGNSYATISLEVCSGYEIEILQTKMSRYMSFKYFSTSVSCEEERREVKEKKKFIEELGIYSDSIIKSIMDTIEKMCYSVLNMYIPTLPETNANNTLEIFKKLLLCQSERLSRTEFDDLYSTLQDKIFEFSHDFIFSAKNISTYNFEYEISKAMNQCIGKEKKLLSKYPDIQNEIFEFRRNTEKVLGEIFVEERNFSSDEKIDTSDKDKPSFVLCKKEEKSDELVSKEIECCNIIETVPARNFKTDKPTWR